MRRQTSYLSRLGIYVHHDGLDVADEELYECSAVDKAEHTETHPVQGGAALLRVEPTLRHEDVECHVQG